MAHQKRPRKAHTLYAGELKELAERLDRSVGTLSRLISGDRPSASLSRRFFEATGFWPNQVEVSACRRPAEEAIAA